MASITNYYVPSSMSKSYVESKRTPEGARAYLQAEQEVDIQKQAALQGLEQQYASTIENAYASYLANQRSIGMSAMGEGYKQLYRQMQEEQLQSNIVEANLSASKARTELAAQTAEAKSDITAMRDLEISNLNKVQGTMQQYLNYVKGLTNEEGQGVLTEEQQKMYIDDLYETLYNLPVKGYTDKDSQAGLSYSEWVRSNLSGTKEDQAWGDWLFSGGLQDFMTAVKRTAAMKPKEIKPYSQFKPYTKDTAPEGYEATSSAEIKSSETFTGTKTNIAKGNKIKALDINNQQAEYTVVSSTPYHYSAIQNSLTTKVDPKSLQLNDILQGKKAGDYFMYIGNVNNQPRFIWLRK